MRRLSIWRHSGGSSAAIGGKGEERDSGDRCDVGLRDCRRCGAGSYGRELLGASKNRVKHRLGEPAGEGVLLAGVVAAD